MSQSAYQSIIQEAPFRTQRYTRLQQRSGRTITKFQENLSNGFGAISRIYTITAITGWTGGQNVLHMLQHSFGLETTSEKHHTIGGK